MFPVTLSLEKITRLGLGELLVKEGMVKFYFKSESNTDK